MQYTIVQFYSFFINSLVYKKKIKDSDFLPDGIGGTCVGVGLPVEEMQ